MDHTQIKNTYKKESYNWNLCELYNEALLNGNTTRANKYFTLLAESDLSIIDL